MRVYKICGCCLFGSCSCLLYTWCLNKTSFPPNPPDYLANKPITKELLFILFTICRQEYECKKKIRIAHLQIHVDTESK